MPTPAGEEGRPSGRDPGLQPERTRLAWQRTALSGALVCSGAAAAAAHRGTPWVLALAAVVAVAVAAATVVAGRLPLDDPGPRIVLGAGLAAAIALVGIALAVS